jgi:hypothetical protein
MPRRKPAFEGSIREELYNRYCQMAERYAATPNPHLFWRVLKSEGYPMTWGGFLYYWRELQIDGVIKVDPVTGLVTITGSRLDLPDEPPAPAHQMEMFP